MTPVQAGVHAREHRSMTAAIEKRLLIWVAQRLPAFVNPDHLSALGLVAMATAGLSVAAMSWSPWAAAGVVASLVANWFGDSLDGTLARVRAQPRPRYGYYVDHVIDLAGATMLVGGMACSGLMNPLIALAVLSAYLLVSSESYLAAHAAGRFRVSFLGFGPTELRIVLAVGVVKAAQTPLIVIAGSAPLRLFDVGGIVVAAGMTAAFVASAARNAWALYREEPLPARRDSRVV